MHFKREERRRNRREEELNRIEKVGKPYKCYGNECRNKYDTLWFYLFCQTFSLTSNCINENNKKQTNTIQAHKSVEDGRTCEAASEKMHEISSEGTRTLLQMSFAKWLGHVNENTLSLQFWRYKNAEIAFGTPNPIHWKEMASKRKWITFYQSVFNGNLSELTTKLLWQVPLSLSPIWAYLQVPSQFVVHLIDAQMQR